MKRLFALGVMLVLLPAPSFAEIFGNPDNGQILFGQRCAACHSVYHNMTGPRLGGVASRKAATLSDYRYSQALRDSGLRWGRDTLDLYLTNPSALVPGTKMLFTMNNPQERADVIAYLLSLPATPK